MGTGRGGKDDVYREKGEEAKKSGGGNKGIEKRMRRADCRNGA